MTAATPFQTGGVVAQMYVLLKEGANAGQAMAILYMTFLFTLVYYFGVTMALWGLTMAGVIAVVGSSYLLLAVAGLFGALALLGGAVVGYPKTARRRLEILIERLEKWGLSTRFAEKMSHAVNECGSSLRLFNTGQNLRFAAAMFLTILIFSNKYFAGYLAARALGLSPPLFELIIIQVFINAVTYFFPTPGGSGGAELGSAVLMSSLIPEQMLGPFTLLWRTATLYLSVLVGGLIIIRYLRADVSLRPQLRRGA